MSNEDETEKEAKRSAVRLVEKNTEGNETVIDALEEPTGPEVFNFFIINSAENEFILSISVKLQTKYSIWGFKRKNNLYISAFLYYEHLKFRA